MAAVNDQTATDKTRKQNGVAPRVRRRCQAACRMTSAIPAFNNKRRGNIELCQFMDSSPSLSLTHFRREQVYEINICYLACDCSLKVMLFYITIQYLYKILTSFIFFGKIKSERLVGTLYNQEMDNECMQRSTQ